MNNSDKLYFGLYLLFVPLSAAIGYSIDNEITFGLLLSVTSIVGTWIITTVIKPLIDKDGE